MAVCQYSGQKPIFHANTRPSLRLMAYGPVGFLGNSLKLRLGFGIIGLEFYWSASGKVSKRAELLFMKVNGKSRLRILP